MKKYQIIYADPPWSYDDKMVGNRIGALANYPTMTIAELCKLNIQKISAKNVALFLWVTSPKLNECWPVIAAWLVELVAFEVQRLARLLTGNQIPAAELRNLAVATTT